jgi:hypothetical protein
MAPTARVQVLMLVVLLHALLTDTHLSQKTQTATHAFPSMSCTIVPLLQRVYNREMPLKSQLMPFGLLTAITLSSIGEQQVSVGAAVLTCSPSPEAVLHCFNTASLIGTAEL